jgi:hypothetical protein
MKPGFLAALCALACLLGTAGCGVPAQTAPVSTTTSKKWPDPKPTKPYKVEELATTIGCTPEFQGTTTDFRQASCKKNNDKYMLLDFATDEGQKDWYEYAIIYGGSYLVGERWIVTSTSEKKMISLQEKIGGAIEQDESMGMDKSGGGHNMTPTTGSGS